MRETPEKAAGRPLRIGIDGRELEGKPTGVARYLRSLLRRFATLSGHEFVIYTRAPIELPAASTRLVSRLLPSGNSLVWEQRRLPLALRDDRIDVLLSPAYSCPMVATVPRVTALHDLSFFARPEEFGWTHGWRRRLLARLSAKVSHSVLAFSEFTRGEIGLRLGPAIAQKTTVILHGPDDDLPPPPSRESSRQALGLDDDTLYLVTVGTILRRRNVSTLVRAVARLRSTFPKLRLGIVGENRSHPFEDVEAFAKSLGCEREVKVSGFVSDEEVTRHYAAADAAVFLSEYEGFGLPALEAMSRGVPAIIADRGSLNELFAPGALLVEPNESAVEDALRRVLSDPAQSEGLRERGRAHAGSFSWERAAGETLAVLERAAS